MDIFGFLWQAIQDLGAFLWNALVFVYNLLVDVGNFLWGAIRIVASFVVDFFRRAADLFRTIWDGFIKRIFSGLMRAINTAHQWLEAHLAPVLKFLRRVRAFYDRWYRLYVQPILNTIQRIRRVLAVLRFLHIKWAQQLDQVLAKIEGKIAQVVLTIRGILNSMIDLVTALADPLMLLRRPTAVLSFRRIFLSLVRVFTGRPPGYFFPSPKKGARNGLGFLPPGFLPGDPTFNPPASTWLPGDDGLNGFNGFTAGTPPDDTAVDDLTVLDYFDDGLYDEPACADPVDCLRQALGLATEKPFIG